MGEERDRFGRFEERAGRGERGVGASSFELMTDVSRKVEPWIDIKEKQDSQL